MILADVREGLAASLRTANVLDGGQVSAYVLSQPTPPCAWVYPAEIDYDEAMQRGHDELVVNVLALVSLVSDIAAQQKLDRLFASSGTGSMKAALETDRTLAGAAIDLRVERCTGYFTYQLTSGPCLGAEWNVRIYAAG